MATTASPYGLKPINLIGGQPYAGSFREIPLTSNIATAFYSGDVIQMGGTTAGQPNPLTATPTTSTGGVVGVCVGVRYQNPSAAGGQFMYAQYLPANAITNGYTNVFIRVVDDPDALFQVQAVGSVAATLRGKFAVLENFGGSTATGNSTIRIGTPANTGTFAVRIVDFVDAGSNFTDCIVKFNFGVHMYNNATVLSN